MKSKMFLFALSATALLLLAGCLTHSVEPRTGETVRQENNSQIVLEYPPYRVIVGYMPSWMGRIDAIDFDKVTHINYAFHVTDTEGNIIPTWINFDEGTAETTVGGDDPKLHKLVEQAHAKGVKVLLSIGGANDKNFAIFALDADLRENFYRESKRVVEQYNLDGLDIDWEFPETQRQGIAFEELMKGVRRALDQLDPDLLLTVAVGGSSYSTNDTSGRSLDPCDWINLMTYDYTGSWPTSGIGSTAPMNFVFSAVELWEKKGISKARMTVGIPFYGVEFLMQGKTRLRVQQMQYNRLNQLFDLDRSTVADTIISGDTTKLYFWDSPDFVAQKTAYALSNNTRGVMIWELTQDLPTDTLSLLGSIWDVMQEYSAELAK